MSLMKCYNGHLFEEEEKTTWYETYGEFQQCETGCPHCKEAYEEAERCLLCNEHFLAGELNNGICEDCLNVFVHNIDMCYEIGSYEKENVSINSMLASLFSEEEIEEILLRELKDAKNVDCSAFINSDIDWFSETLAELLKED